MLPIIPLVGHRSYGTPLSCPPPTHMGTSPYRTSPDPRYLPTWGPRHTATPRDMFRLIHLKLTKQGPQTSVGRRAVGIRLKCLLVMKCSPGYFNAVDIIISSLVQLVSNFMTKKSLMFKFNCSLTNFKHIKNNVLHKITHKLWNIVLITVHEQKLVQ